jgi:hypothetical protein
MKAGREQSMQVLHMMAENKAPHLSHRYHVYVTALSTYYRLIRLYAYQRAIERDYSTNVTVTPATISTKRMYWSRQSNPSVIIRTIAGATMHGTRRVA